MISGQDFKKWLQVFNIKSGGSAASGTVDPGTINEIAYYAANGDTVSGLATANNGLLVTSAAGVPSIGNTIGASISVSATSNAVLRYLVKNSSNGTAAESQLRVENDVSGGGVRLLGSEYTAIPSYTNRMLVYGDSGVTGGILIRTTSASGGIQLTADNSINNPNLLVDSSGNTSLSGSLTTSQTAGIIGTTTNNDADAGSVGEYMSSSVGGGGAVSLTSGSPVNITSLSLSQGDWDIWGNVLYMIDQNVTVLQYGAAGISTTSATLPPAADRIGFDFGSSGVVPTKSQGNAFNVKAVRARLSSTTTYYLTAEADFTTSTCKVFGGIFARRRR